jgi:hypothetical protein
VSWRCSVDGGGGPLKRPSKIWWKKMIVFALATSWGREIIFDIKYIKTNSY